MSYVIATERCTTDELETDVYKRQAIGILTLIAVNLTGSFTGVYLPVSLVSVCCAAFGGVPGVTLMLGLSLIHILFRRLTDLNRRTESCFIQCIKWDF